MDDQDALIDEINTLDEIDRLIASGYLDDLGHLHALSRRLEIETNIQKVCMYIIIVIEHACCDYFILYAFINCSCFRTGFKYL